MLRTGEYQQRAAELGEHLHRELGLLVAAGAARAVRGRGLWAGVDIDPAYGRAGEISERLMDRGRPGQGHPRLDDPDRPAAGDQQGGSGLGTGSAAGGTGRRLSGAPVAAGRPAGTTGGPPPPSSPGAAGRRL